MTTKFILAIALFVGLAFYSCTNQDSANEITTKEDTISCKEINKAQNLVSIIEIPTTDLKRAITFYKAILGVEIDEADMGNVKMGIIRTNEGTVNVVLANGVDYKPSSDGSILYLYEKNNLQTILEKVEPNGGKVLVPKTEISPEMGFFALFIDTEGNRMGLHSAK